MKKFGRETIRYIVNRAIEEFNKDSTKPEIVSFYFKGHYVQATIDWSPAMSCYYVYDFIVIYSICVMRYKVGEDFDLNLSWCN